MPVSLPDLRRVSCIALDTETRDDRLQQDKGPGWPMRAGHLVGLSIAWRNDSGLCSTYLPIAHPASDNLDRAQVFAWVRDLLAPGGPRIVTQNGLYDFGWLRTEAGIAAPADGRWEEIGAAATLIDENRFSYGLDDLCKWRGLPGKDDTLLRSTVEQTFNVRCTTRGKNAPQAYIWQLPAALVAPYAKQDALSTLLLHENLAPELDRQGLRDAYDLDRALLPLVLEMSARGIRVDTETAARNSALFKQKRDAVLAEIASKLEISAVDMEDLNNTKWLAATCDRLAITYPRTTKGNPSFTSSAAKLGWMRQHAHWFPPLVVRAKEFHTAASKFLDLYVLDFAVNGRIYPSIHPFRSDDGGTRSSRFSYSDPPLQQMASHDSEIAGPVRRGFLPEPGEAWATIDYKQQEFRLLVQEAATRGLRGAHDALVRYCTDPDTDFHVLVAEIANIERETAKRANFANAYRAGLKKFAFTIVKPEAEAKAIREQLADKVPFVAELAAECEKQANRDSYITLFDGTRRHYDLWNVRFSDNDDPNNKACDYATAQRRQRNPNHPWFAGKLQRAGAYFAMNALIQGNGARQTKRWMLDCWREGIVPLLQMHDGLELSIGEPAQAERVATLARETVSFDVPMPADIKYGRTWADVAKHSWAELPAPQPPNHDPVDYRQPPKILATQRVSLIPPRAEDFPNLDAFVAFVIERHAMYQRRQAGEPWPWTQDPILGAWSFCNMYRALDRTTQWIWQHWCEPNVDDSDLWFAMLIARLVNRIETLEALGWPVPWDPAHFVDVMAKRPKGKLYGAAYVSPAFAGDHRPKYVTQADRIFTPMWENRETLRPRPGMLVAEFAEGLRSYAGLGDGFLAAQVVADTKPFGALHEAADYQSFALSGNGSRAGLNNVMGRPTDASWRKNDRDWYQRLTELCALTAPIYQDKGLPPSDFQDEQNRLCEFSKWWAIHSGEKQRLKRKYEPAAAPKPARTKKSLQAPPIVPTEIPDYILADMAAVNPAPRLKAPRHSDVSPDVPISSASPESASSPATALPSQPSASPSLALPHDSGSWAAAKRDGYAEDNAGKPFNDAFLLRKGYQFTRAFDYTLPDGTPLYQQRRYDLQNGIPPIADKRPRKRFLIRRQVNSAWVFGSGPRRVLYNWPAIVRAGPGSTVLIPEGEGKVDDLTARGLLAATVVSHDWTGECIAALSGCHVIVLADQDGSDSKHKDGARLADEARRALAPVAASLRVVPYLHLWQHLPADQRGDAPVPNEDIADWLKKGGDATWLLEICHEIPTTSNVEPVDLWAQFEPPALPIELLPKTIADFVSEQSELIGADPGGLALAALTVCAAAIPDRIKLAVKRHGGWRESARLWVAEVGPVSGKKTPILNTATWPLVEIDMALCRIYAAAKQQWDELPADQRKKQPRPKHVRIRLEDTTIEAAQEILRDSPDGVLCRQDELSGWFGSMDKYSGHRGAARDRSFWLQASNGGSYVFDRIARGSGLIENLSVSLLGGIQPELMREVAADTSDDGLIQRLVPIMLRPASVGKDMVLPAAVFAYNDLIRDLHTLIAPTDPLQFDAAGMMIRDACEREHHDLMACETFNRKLAAHIGKYDGIFARLCLIWHCVESHTPTPAATISGNTAQRVADFLHRFLLPHAAAFYASIYGLSDEHDRLANIAGYILAHKLDVLTNRVIQRGDRSMRGLKKYEIENVCHQLSALGWVDPIPGARPTDPPRWAVNPEVHRLFAIRATQEAERRQRERELIAEFFKQNKP